MEKKMAFIEGTHKTIERIDGNPCSLAQQVHIVIKSRCFFHGHRLIGAPGRKHGNFKFTGHYFPVVLKRIDGSEFSTDEETQTAELIEYISKELKSTLGQEKNHVMIMGDGEIAVGEVTRVQKIIGDAFEDIESTFIAVKEL